VTIETIFDVMSILKEKPSPMVDISTEKSFEAAEEDQ